MATALNTAKIEERNATLFNITRRSTIHTFATIVQILQYHNRDNGESIQCSLHPRGAGWAMAVTNVPPRLAQIIRRHSPCSTVAAMAVSLKTLSATSCVLADRTLPSRRLATWRSRSAQTLTLTRFKRCSTDQAASAILASPRSTAGASRSLTRR